MATRQKLFTQLEQSPRFDVAIIGGGATGLGIALDAAARGFKVALFESHDFAKGTSSRATKLVHGGVRYLAQGNISLVREALHERTTLLANAPHLAQPLAFVMPSYAWWQAPFYGIGLKMYDVLAGKAGLGRTEFLSRNETLKLLPNARENGLTGGVKYWDGQFDDARLALALAQTAASRGALLMNYCAATGLIYENGKVTGLKVQDKETGQNYEVQAGCVINAAGVWVDEFRQMDGEQTKRPVKAMVAPSQGTHLVVDREFMPSDHAILIPKTADGRVLFIVPWLGKLILGTTDSPRDDLAREPAAFKDDTGFILGEAAKYLTRAPQRSDVKSIWVGLRPLVKPPDEEGGNTKKLSREHTILVSKSGLVTVTGGKWTTYRAMAEDVLDQAFEAKLLPTRPGAVTVKLPLIGSQSPSQRVCDAPGLHQYGSLQNQVLAMPGADIELCPGLTEAMVRYAARHEYARTVEDMLARRSRLLFLDAKLAASISPQVANIMQEETGRDPDLAAFIALAEQYSTLPE
ncbi:MAG: glycerol-3-phosphate dehydrogenase/oxidase [Brachymonas sp.]|nr:glycerol-3-phosphate dehydrogenase/oxidase [Brachymonas sp.]